MSVFGIQVGAGTVSVYKAGVSKRDALNVLINIVAETDAVTDVEAFRRSVHDREAVMSTGIGSGVAIPHVRIDEISRPTVAVGVSHEGIDFDTLDHEPVHVVVLFAMPSGSQREYLGLLAQVMLSLKTPGFRDKLVGCQTPEEIVDVLADADLPTDPRDAQRSEEAKTD